MGWSVRTPVEGRQASGLLHGTSASKMLAPPWGGRLKPGQQLLAVEPGLEHEDVPEVEVPVAGAGLVFLPLLADGGGVGVAFSFEAG